MIQSATLKFLRDLKKNNNKAWFDEHRRQYEQAKNDFVDFVDRVIRQLSKHDPTIGEQQAKNCVFRINRDVRFSKDKSPYKTNFGASVNQGGKKSKFAGYYIHCEPGAFFCGAGVWMPMPPELRNIRQEIDYSLDELKSILSAPGYRKYYDDLYTGDDMQLSRVPKGYAPDNPAAPYLRLKSFFCMAAVDDKSVQAANFIDEITRRLKATKPLIDFLNRAITE